MICPGASSHGDAPGTKETSMRKLLSTLGLAIVMSPALSTFADTPTGEIQGAAFEHTDDTAVDVIGMGSLALPAAATGGAPYFGEWKDAPIATKARVPTIVFLHGSSGLTLKAVEDWQRWLADLGYASFAPDSFALPNRVTYRSPIPKAVYEKIHTLRASEIVIALDAVKAAPWADPAALVLAGASEGAVAVARHSGAGFKGRMIFSWSCETNYFVGEHRTAVGAGVPVLNVVSTVDPFFSPANPWLGNAAATGDCGAALAGNPAATIVRVPGAPHTLLNLPEVHTATAAFLHDAFHR